jgi:hypothetical protein
VPRALIIQYRGQDAHALTERIRREGFESSVYAHVGIAGFRALRENPPDVALIDLRAMPSYGRTIGVLFRESKSLRTIPLVFLEGDPLKSGKVRAVLPDVEIAGWERLGPALRRAVSGKAKPPIAPIPPDTPLHRKLRIRPDSEVALLHAPPGIRATLGELPAGVRCRAAIGDAAVVLCFVKSAAALRKELPVLAGAMRSGRTLWILWPKKASTERTDLSMPVIREMCHPYGLGEYKVCAFDAIWSAMAFSGRTDNKRR